ncbi:hypothetical protein [Nocardia altamirensis]|nr:hypothetical protein [Nocardia altamirensis]
MGQLIAYRIILDTSRHADARLLAAPDDGYREIVEALAALALPNIR